MTSTPESDPTSGGDWPATPPPPGTPVAPPVPPGYGYTQAGVPIPVFPDGKPRVDIYGNPVSEKSRLVAALLCWFLGVFGVHRFYVGKVGTGLLMLFTFGGLGVWAVIDLIIILVGAFKDKAELPIVNW